MMKMPRIYNSGPAGGDVDQWYEKTGEGTSSWDVCKSCARELEGALISDLRSNKDNYELIQHGEKKGFPDMFKFKFEPYGSGPDKTDPDRKSIDEPDGELDGGCEHPPYSDEEYDCNSCGKRLRDSDN